MTFKSSCLHEGYTSRRSWTVSLSRTTRAGVTSTVCIIVGKWIYPGTWFGWAPDRKSGSFRYVSRICAPSAPGKLNSLIVTTVEGSSAAAKPSGASFALSLFLVHKNIRKRKSWSSLVYVHSATMGLPKVGNLACPLTISSSIFPSIRVIVSHVADPNTWSRFWISENQYESLLRGTWTTCAWTSPSFFQQFVFKSSF